MSQVQDAEFVEVSGNLANTEEAVSMLENVKRAVTGSTAKSIGLVVIGVCAGVFGVAAAAEMKSRRGQSKPGLAALPGSTAA